MSRERLHSESYKRSRVQNKTADFLLEIFGMLSALVVLLSQLLLYFCAANSIYEGSCQYVNDSVTHGAITHTVRTFLEDAIFVPDIAKNPFGSTYVVDFHQRSSTKRYKGLSWGGISHNHVTPILKELLNTLRSQLNFNDNGIPYGCKAIKCSLKGGAGIDVEVSCAIGKSSAMLTTYFLKRHFDDYFKSLHSTLRWDNEMAANALNYQYVEDKMKKGYLWSEVPREISRVDYNEVSELVKDVIPTLFTDEEQKTIKTYDVRYDTKYGCSVQVNRKDMLMNVGCLLYATHHKLV
ncbi:hypothetical protein Q1695_004049 [Nippostrongylus brasiliensis]|nr:hypothetical protein Q1695_004049 [Nippostrongylus brasiliensis]